MPEFGFLLGMTAFASVLIVPFFGAGLALINFLVYKFIKSKWPKTSELQLFWRSMFTTYGILFALGILFLVVLALEALVSSVSYEYLLEWTLVIIILIAPSCILYFAAASIVRMIKLKSKK